MTTIAVLSLLDTVRHHAQDPDLLHVLDHHPIERSWLQLPSTNDLELWLISWPPGASTGWHDHGPSAGAFTVLRGSLLEHTWQGALQLHHVGVGDANAFTAGFVHDVGNAAPEPALSLHAYSPRLETMTRYRFHGDRLEILGVEKEGESW
jgi:quercetin dioxygenase-like cupin family protein